jgi:serpin B
VRASPIRYPSRYDDRTPLHLARISPALPNRLSSPILARTKPREQYYCLSMNHFFSRLTAPFATVARTLSAQPVSPATKAINQLGLDLLRSTGNTGANNLLSPYSIQSALAMTYAGAAGETRAEMARVLYYPDNEQALHGAFAALRDGLEQAQQVSVEIAARSKQPGGPSEPIALMTANRLFGQKGYEFRQTFLDLMRDVYAAPFQPMDFKHAATAAALEINGWVQQQTENRIRDLVSPASLSQNTSLVLVNAIYLKAPWDTEFYKGASRPEPFYLIGNDAIQVPTMKRTALVGCREQDGFTAVTLPYSGGGLQLLVLLPDAKDGLASLEKILTAELLAACAELPSREVVLHLPKLKLTPPVLRLSSVLQALGMRTAFDQPPGSANFDRMAPRKPQDYLRISEVLHKTFLSLDEQGTEAAAAAAVAMIRCLGIAPSKPKPIEVRVDHPFLFAIQHRSSGVCLFLGRVTDPR